MADLILNVDFAPSQRPGKKATGNQKHRRFLRRRRGLREGRGLKQDRRPRQDRGPKGDRGLKRDRGLKQDPPPPPPAGGSQKKPPRRNRGGGEGGETAAATGAAPLQPTPSSNGPASSPQPKPLPRRLEKRLPAFSPPQPGKTVAIDCEMVGTGPGGRCSDLARCSIVSYHGDVLYDRYVRPAAPIVDYRTRWSGIRQRHMVNAVPFGRAQRQILRLLSGRLVVGHAIHNDFKALRYQHPRALTRDTSRIPLLNRRAGLPEGAPVSLKRLAKHLLHRDIQVGQSGHCSVEDARATMELYRLVEAEWEQHLLLHPEPE